MLASEQKWQLFGLDVRRLGEYWRIAWAEFLWGDQSPLRAHLDEVVRVHAEGGEFHSQAGARVPPAEALCEAVMLPDDLVLFKTLKIPIAAEAELAAVMELEVAANSPFPERDTGSGWTLLERTESILLLQLAIVSLSASMRYLGRQYERHDSRQQEVWAQAGDRPIVLRGFGEHRRLGLYQKRLVRIAGLAACSVVLMLAMVALAAGSKYLKLQQFRELSATVSIEASEASAMRSDLARANASIAAVNEIIRAHPNPHVELARLTQLLGDEAYLAQFTMRGNEIDLRARATDAAGVFGNLAAEDAFVEVTAPGATTRLGNTGVEQFSVNIRLTPESEQ